MNGKKATLDDVVRFCSIMIDNLTDIFNNTTNELIKDKIGAKIGTYYTILRYIYEDAEDV